MIISVYMMRMGMMLLYVISDMTSSMADYDDEARSQTYNIQAATENQVI